MALLHNLGEKPMAQMGSDSGSNAWRGCVYSPGYN
jgi:hypothetical protein